MRQGSQTIEMYSLSNMKVCKLYRERSLQMCISDGKESGKNAPHSAGFSAIKNLTSAIYLLLLSHIISAVYRLHKSFLSNIVLYPLRIEPYLATTVTMEAPALPTPPQKAPEVLAQQITLLHMECSYYHNVITEVKFLVDTDTLNLFWRTHIVSSVRKIFYIRNRKTPPKISGIAMLRKLSNFRGETEYLLVNPERNNESLDDMIDLMRQLEEHARAIGMIYLVGHHLSVLFLLTS